MPAKENQHLSAAEASQSATFADIVAEIKKRLIELKLTWETMIYKLHSVSHSS